jgi:hypothetical protein
MPQDHETNWKHLGEKNQLLFMAECMKRGWKVNMPYGEDCRYDVVVDTPKGLRRIQIKSCHKADARGRYRINMHHGRRIKHSYTTEECDLIAAYVTPLNHWFIVPVDRLTTQHLDLAFHHHDCLEAWHLIHEDKRRKTVS